MTSKEIRKLRKFLKMSQKEFAAVLGLKRRMIQYYEKGERDGDSIEIPKTVELACYAVAQGVHAYRFEGPDDDGDEARPPKAKKARVKAKARAGELAGSAAVAARPD